MADALICSVGFTTSDIAVAATECNQTQAHCGHEASIKCSAWRHHCGGSVVCRSVDSGQWAPLQLSRWPSYDAPRPAIMSECNPIPVVRSCYAVWSTLPRPPVHWQTADHGNGMAGRRGAVIRADATAPASSTLPPSALRPKLAPPGT